MIIITIRILIMIITMYSCIHLHYIILCDRFTLYYIVLTYSISLRCAEAWTTSRGSSATRPTSTRRSCRPYINTTTTTNDNDETNKIMILLILILLILMILQVLVVFFLRFFRLNKT